MDIYDRYHISFRTMVATKTILVTPLIKGGNGGQYIDELDQVRSCPVNRLKLFIKAE